jgi:excisionase family DNA binding protein
MAVRTSVSSISTATVQSTTPPVRSRHCLSVPEAAAYLCSSNWHIEELIRCGEIPFRQIAKHRVLDADDLDTWIESQPKQRGNGIEERGDGRRVLKTVKAA